jgi:myosin heavy subunit
MLIYFPSLNFNDDTSQGSKLKFVSRLFDTHLTAAGFPETAGSRRAGGGSGLKSLSATFRADLASLMEAISAADPHFVRAVNPNSQVLSFSLWYF